MTLLWCLLRRRALSVTRESSGNRRVGGGVNSEIGFWGHAVRHWCMRVARSTPADPALSGNRGIFQSLLLLPDATVHGQS